MSVGAGNPFGITAKELSDMVNQAGEKPEILGTYGGTKGIAAKICADMDKGLSGQETDLVTRRNFFGKNYVEGKRALTFFELCWNALEDLTLRILMAGALVSIILSVIPGIQEVSCPLIVSNSLYDFKNTLYRRRIMVLYLTGLMEQ